MSVALANVVIVLMNESTDSPERIRSGTATSPAASS